MEDAAIAKLHQNRIIRFPNSSLAFIWKYAFTVCPGGTNLLAALLDMTIVTHRAPVLQAYNISMPR